MNLDRLDLEALDPSGMHARIAGMGEDAAAATRAAAALDWVPAAAPPRAVLLAGMGGSAISGDLLRGYAGDELAFPLVSVRDYALPGWAGPDCLLIACSYSGDTEETLAVYRAARARGVPRVAIGSGGRLLALAREDGIPSAAVPPGSPPRAALGWMFFTLLGGFEKLGFLAPRPAETAEAIERIRQAARAMGPASPEAANLAKRLARALHGRLPILYSGERPMGPVALRWRTQINENAKTLASSHVLPELDHNEIVGSEEPRELLRKCQVLALRDREDHPRVLARLEITRRLLEKAGIATLVLDSEGAGRLARMFSHLVLGDWVSLYLSFIYGVDPTPVHKIDYLKIELERAGAA